jgi:CelD/BcsL family acetyltransferase involved in cellulose biosynthesis
MQPLERGEADLLLLRNLDVAGTLRMAASASCGWLRRSHAEEISGRWMVKLPGALDELLASRSAKTRSTLRRHERKLQSEFGERLRLRRFENVQDMQELQAGLEHVSARAYQRGLGAGYSNSPLDNALLELTLRQGRHRTWMLYLDNRPVAFWMGTICGGTFAIGTPGFDPDFARESFGRFTMLRMLQDLCVDPSIDLLDFGHGEAEYKSAFGECMRTETGIILTSRRALPIAATQLSSALSLINNQGRRLVRDAEWGKKLKKKWRNRTGFGVKAGAAT